MTHKRSALTRRDAAEDMRVTPTLNAENEKTLPDYGGNEQARWQASGEMLAYLEDEDACGEFDADEDDCVECFVDPEDEGATCQ